MYENSHNPTSQENPPPEKTEPLLHEAQREKETSKATLQFLGGLNDISQFINYCDENKVKFPDQQKLVCELYEYCSNAEYYRSLLEYALGLFEVNQLREQLLSRIKGLPIVPSSDVPSVIPKTEGVNRSEPTAQVVFGASQDTPVKPFWLSENGSRISMDTWRNFVHRLVLAGYFDKEQIRDIELLLGINRRDEMLKRHIRFHGDKNHVAFLFGALYGTLFYELKKPYDVPAIVYRRMDCACSVHFEPGTYCCPNLIVVPRGQGPNAQGVTRERYWGIVAPAISYDPPIKPTKDPEHSYSNALQVCRTIEPQKVAPLLVALQPMGFKRVVS
ncbi:MAG: hypothetical protein II555_02090 [Bacteroidales bacterium]|nr:hypothetical protein [Bacteroidales bacterium]